MSCSDILLSFLADMGDDFADQFQFLDCDADSLVSGHYDKSSIDLNRKDFNCVSSEGGSSPVYSTYSCDSDDELTAIHPPEGYSGWDFNVPELVSASLDLQFQESTPAPSKKRKSEYTKKSDKKCRQTVEEKMATVVGLLKDVKAHKSFFKPKSTKMVLDKINGNPVATVEAILRATLASTASNPKDLLKFFAPSAVLHSTALSSLHAQAQMMRSKMHLNAWSPSVASQPFPDKHIGVGQISGASRSFMSSIGDLLSGSNTVSHKLKFHVELVKHAVVVSAMSDQVAAPFNWRTEGLVSQGSRSTEVEFNGLIRCTFGEEGVLSASISFDACAPVRQCSALPLSVV